MPQANWAKSEIDGYVLLDANVIWTPNKHLELMLAGQNLLNSSQQQYRSEYSTPGTEIERGGYGKLTWKFLDASNRGRQPVSATKAGEPSRCLPREEWREQASMPHQACFYD